jgi:PhnB protein
MLQKGLTFRSEIIRGKGGKQVILEDPSGNPIELFQPSKPRPGSFKPEGYYTVTPYLAIKDADRLVEFIRNVFDAEEHKLWRHPDGTFMHGEFRIGDSLVMVGDVRDRHDPFPGMMYLYIPDVDSVYQKALAEGAASIEEPADQDYGDRRAAFQDPAGNRWYVAACITENL